MLNVGNRYLSKTALFVLDLKKIKTIHDYSTIQSLKPERVEFGYVFHCF